MQGMSNVAVFMSVMFALFYQVVSLSPKFDQSRGLRVEYEARITGIFYFRCAIQLFVEVRTLFLLP